MKKIISLLLVLALAVGCMFILASCGDQTPDTDNNNSDNNGDNNDNNNNDNNTPGDGSTDGTEEQSDLEAVANMYENSHPTKIVSESTQTVGSLVLNRTDVLTTGTVNGLKAAIYESASDEMRTVEEGGATSEILEPTYTKHTILHYLEGKGTREIDPETGASLGKWKEDGQNLIPERGAIAINLDKTAIEEYEFKDNVLSFTVAAEDTETVLGNAVDADVNVSVVTDGAIITAISMSYSLAANAENNVPATTVEISVAYSYDIEYITMS